jgi:hypothetical protein
VFVGDAAHAVSPQMGVGCTSGLADSVLLAELAASMQGKSKAEGNGVTTESTGGEKGTEAVGLGSIGAEWTKSRWRDAYAYVRMSKSLNDLAYYKFHKNPLMWIRAAPEAVPMVLFKTRFPGRSAHFLTPQSLLCLSEQATQTSREHC